MGIFTEIFHNNILLQKLSNQCASAVLLFPKKGKLR